MDALRQKAGAVNWDDDSDEEEEEEDASPPRPAPVAKRAAAPAQAAPKRGAPPAAPSRRAPPSSDDEDEEEDDQTSTEEEEVEEDDDGSVSEMSAGAGAAPAGRPDTPSERTTSSDTDEEDDDEDEGAGVGAKRSSIVQQGSAFSRAAPGGGGTSFSRAGSARSQPERAQLARGRGGDGDAAIDWALVERQLAAVPPAFKQATFDPVPHVVEILNAAQPDAELDKLQDLQVSIDGLVTDVVAAYSTGFSRALQNYSQVLALFTAGSTHVSRATRSLDEAGTHLSSRKPALQAQWLRAATAAAVCRTLDSIAQCASYDDRIAACLRDNRPVEAVSVLMETAAALEREEMRSVPGLRSLRTGLALRRGTLFEDLLARLLARIYDTGAALGGASDDAILSGSGTKGGEGDKPQQQQPQQQANPLADAPGRPAAPSTAVPPGAAPPADGSFAALQSGLAQYRAAAAVALSGEAAEQETAGGLGASGVGGSNSPSSGASVEELVDAMLRLSTGPGGGGNGSSAVRDALTQKHGDQVRVLIAAHLARAVPRSSRGASRGGLQPPPTALAQALSIIPPGGVPSQALLLAVADSPAVEALDNVCAALLTSLRAYMRAQRRVVESPVAWQDVKGPLTGTPPSMAYKQEAVRAWGLVHTEVERLLAAMLAPPQTQAGDASGGDGSGAGKGAQAPLLRGTAAVAARKAEEQAAVAAKALAAQAAGAQAVAQAGVFTFGLGELLGDALVQAAPPTPGTTAAATAASSAPTSQPGQPDAGTMAVGALLDGGYAAAAALLPGCGVHLAPFATAPVTRLSEAVAAEFPECTGVGSDDVALVLPPDAAAAQQASGRGGDAATQAAEPGKSLRLGKSSSRRSRRTGGTQQEAQPR